MSENNTPTAPPQEPEHQQERSEVKTEESTVKNEPQEPQQNLPTKNKVEEEEEEVKEQTTPQSVTGKKFSFSLKDQTPVKDINVVDLIYWRNVYATLVVFLSGHAVFTLLTKFQFSITTLIGRTLLFQVILFTLYTIAYRIWTNSKDAPIPFSNFELTEELVLPYVRQWIQTINKAVRFYVDVLIVKDLKKTLKVLGALQLLCMVGNMFSGLVLLYVSFLFAFTLPKIYEVEGDNIDKYALLAWKKTKEQAAKLYEKIPPPVKEKIAQFTAKVSEFQSSLIKKKSE